MRTHSSLMSMTRRDKEALYGTMAKSHDYLRQSRDASPTHKRSTVDKILEPIEVGGAAALIGLIAGRTGTTSIANTGIPLGLVAGAACHGVAALDLLGEKYNHHLQRIGNGAIAGWTALWGAGQGLQLRERAGGVVGPITSGVPQPASAPASYAYPAAPPQMMAPPPNAHPRRPLTEAELQQLDRSIR